MQIRSFELPPIGTNAFLISDSALGKAVLVDAPLAAFRTVSPILEKEGLELEALLLTHGHFDHMLDTVRFNEANIPVYAHKADVEWIEEPEIQSRFLPMGQTFEGGKVTHVLEGNETLEFLGQSIELRFVPGHCPGSVLFHFSKEKVAFVGDAIFAGSIGRTDLPGGNHEQLLQSIREQIFTLPGDTVLFPGHGPQTSVASEIANNPFFR